MVEFIHGVVALLAGLILVLTALVGWLYLQQSRMSHAINALAVAITAPPPSFMYSSLDKQHSSDDAPMPPQHGEDHDDRMSVHEAVDSSSAPMEDISADIQVLEAQPAAEATAEAAAAAPSADDDVAGKTISQLRDMLTAKGIPFNKSDKKSTLISLVQVSA
jgi:hypothetical protein